MKAKQTLQTGGVIYIMTNPSFPEYVKIGYADNVQTRLQQLNKSEVLPFAFRVYATYRVNQRLSDKTLHRLIDSLNPDLRTREDFNGKTRVREFYVMSAERAYELLYSIASLSGTLHNLHKTTPQGRKNKMKEKPKKNAMILLDAAESRLKNSASPLAAHSPLRPTLKFKCVSLQKDESSMTEKGRLFLLLLRDCSSLKIQFRAVCTSNMKGNFSQSDDIDSNVKMVPFLKKSPNPLYTQTRPAFGLVLFC